MNAKQAKQLQEIALIMSPFEGTRRHSGRWGAAQVETYGAPAALRELKKKFKKVPKRERAEWLRRIRAIVEQFDE